MLFKTRLYSNSMVLLFGLNLIILNGYAKVNLIISTSIIYEGAFFNFN